MYCNEVHWTLIKYKAVPEMKNILQVINLKGKLMEWNGQVEDCRQSGMAVEEWCHERGILKSTY